MKLKFKEEKDFSSTKVESLKKALEENKKSTVVLHHSEYCGHCVAMRGEFDKFSGGSTNHIIEIEGGALGTLQKHKKIYSKVCPKDGSMYFPMIVIFIKRTYDLTPKKYIYEGPRTAEGLHNFIKTKEQSHKKVHKKK
jgi:hypothetical protein